MKVGQAFSDGSTAGVDEAGRGPLAGPVVAAAVILNPKKPIRGLDDSKVLSKKKRTSLSAEIRKSALAWSVAWADKEEIDVINILQATLLAMQRALQGLKIVPHLVLVDGNRCPQMTGPLTNCQVDAVIGGDGSVPAISAASILAKVHRDNEMKRLDRLFPEYGFAQHKGYATKTHLSRIDQYGPCPIHRRSFSPIRKV